MLLFFKSSSKTVDESSLLDPHDTHNKDSSSNATSLTVWRKSLLFNCKGFTVIGCDGNLVYRVDCYDGRPSQVILMDESGHPLLTLLRRKKLGLVDNWFIFEGEEEIEDLNSNSSQAKKAIYVFRRNRIILAANLNVLAHVYRGMNEKRYAYVIEGSYANRSCRIVDSESKKVVAEVKKKEAMKGESHVSFGSEVFLLIVKNGFDSKFAMAFILLLDQIFS